MAVHRAIEPGTEAHVGFAESRLRTLERVAAANGGSASQMYQPEGSDGPSILVRVTPFQSQIIITGGGTEMLNGMVDQGSIIQDAGTGKMYRFYPTSEQAVAEHGARAFRNEIRLAVQAEADIDLPTAGDPYAQAGVIAPAMFTGLMTKVAQAALGLTRRKIGYRWHFTQTHGVYKASNGVPWLIEISQNRGVLAMKLPTLSKLTKKSQAAAPLLKSSLGFIPSGVGFPKDDKILEAIAAGTVRILASPTALDAFYAKNPFFYDCGWAFNMIGLEAQNTCWSWPDDYKRGHRFKITIALNGLGEPSSASVAEVESGFLYNWPLKESRLYFPAQSNDFSVFTFDMAKAGAFPGPSPVASWSAPVYVFYRGNAEAVYRQKAGGSAPTSIEVPDFLPNDDTTTNQGEVDGGDATPVNGPFIGFSGPDIEDDINYSVPYHTKTRYKAKPDGRYGDVQWTATQADIDADPYSAQFGGFAVYDLNRLYQEVTTYNNAFIVQKSSLVISPRNRSCVFVAKYYRKYTGDIHVVRDSLAAGPVNQESTIVYRYRYLYGDVNDPHHIAYFAGAAAGSSNVNVALGDGVTGGGYKFFPGTTMFDVQGNVSTGGINPNMYPALPARPLTILPVMSSTTVPNTETVTKTVRATMTETSELVTADANFGLFYEVSPDAGENFTRFNSGYSAFKKHRFFSKGPNSIQGADCQSVSDEPIAQCHPRISWVGYA